MHIVDFKPLNKGALTSQVSLKIPKWGNFIIKGIKVFEKEGSRWIAFPAFEYEKDGKKQFYSHCAFESKDMMEAFRTQFFKAYDEYLQLKGNAI